MEKPSVTINYTAALWLGGILLALAVVMGIVEIPAKGLDGWLLAALMAVLGLLLLWVGTQKEIIDETGIRTQGLFRTRGCAWPEILEVGVASQRHRSGKGHYPQIFVTGPGGVPRKTAGKTWILRNLFSGFLFDYRKGIWDCILHYYGEPDFDEWGQPPTVS